MTRLAHLLLFAAWIVGAVTGGLIVQPDAPEMQADVHLVAESDWSRLTVRSNQIVLTVRQGANQWRAAAPLPAFIREWLHPPDLPIPSARRAPPPESVTFIPL